MNKRNIIMVFVIIFLVLALFFSVFNFLVYPFSDMHTIDRIIKFKIIGFASRIILDDNPYFTSPEIIKKPFITDLEPRTYYWRTNLLSPTRTFTIDSAVTINLLKKENRTYTVQNKGNTIIDLIIRNIKDFAITGKAMLGLNEELDIKIENSSAIGASQSETAETGITGKVIVTEAEQEGKQESWLKKNSMLVLVVIILILTFVHILIRILKKKKNETFKY